MREELEESRSLVRMMEGERVKEEEVEESEEVKKLRKVLKSKREVVKRLREENEEIMKD
jgi:hypothetical protein